MKNDHFAQLRSTEEAALLSKYANPRGAKSVKSLLNTLLALLSLPHIGTLPHTPRARV
jgi:hypothetical protein